MSTVCKKAVSASMAVNQLSVCLKHSKSYIVYCYECSIACLNSRGSSHKPWHICIIVMVPSPKH